MEGEWGTVVRQTREYWLRAPSNAEEVAKLINVALRDLSTLNRNSESPLMKIHDDKVVFWFELTAKEAEVFQ